MLERDLQRCLCFELGLLLELCIQEQPSNKNHQDRQHCRDQVHSGPSDGLFLFLTQVAHGSGQHLPKMYQSQLLAAITERVFLCAQLKQRPLMGQVLAEQSTHGWSFRSSRPRHDLCRKTWGAAQAFQGASLRRSSALVALVTRAG